MANNSKITTIDVNTTDIDTEPVLEYEYYNYSNYHTYDSVMWEKQLGYDLLRYFCPILLICGVLGNLMSFVVFSTKSMNASVSSIFFRALAIVDTLSLCSCLPRLWVIAVFQYDIRELHILVCKIQPFVVYWSTHMSAWILSAVALDRAIGVSMPHRYKSLVTRQRAIILLVATILALGALDSYLLVSQVFEVIVYAYSNETYIECNVHQHLNTSVWSYIDMAVYCVCPFTIICLSNICIIYFLIRASIQRKISMTTNQDTSKTSNVSAILLTISFVYLVCTMPIVLYFLVEDIWWKAGITWKQLSQLKLYYTSAMLMSAVNNAVNFILYCLSGPGFRRALVNMFVKK